MCHRYMIWKYKYISSNTWHRKAMSGSWVTVLTWLISDFMDTMWWCPYKTVSFLQIIHNRSCGMSVVNSNYYLRYGIVAAISFIFTGLDVTFLATCMVGQVGMMIHVSVTLVHLCRIHWWKAESICFKFGIWYLYIYICIEIFMIQLLHRSGPMLFSPGICGCDFKCVNFKHNLGLFYLD